VLERSRPRRAFRRIEGAALTALLPAEAGAQEDQPEGGPVDPATDPKTGNGEENGGGKGADGA
jgi:proteasome alpha subunit